ncbi:MAG: ABC transporter permease [Deltaproteobacteria bacterium]|nr:ABC transporter permease [Deltaproteobacteria bacterium]MBW1953060.1 ABC transporter permease [Deltaproteobacteria bacterium]MBW1986700.1 ABC transporter permease [Deltaproteobacteria bacterium]MBW2134546.1 ABC transporter permease [Deltaproteobacteria bacterium]
MKIPLSYSFRNLWTRRLTTILTAGGMSLVVFVFASVLMLAEGLRQTLVATGSYDNALVLRSSAESEVQSVIDRDQAAIVASQPEIALNPQGMPLVSPEVVVLINLPKQSTGQRSNVTIRGVKPISLEMRPEIKLAAGRFFRPGSTEIVVGESVARRFADSGLGQTLRFAMRNWNIVGILDAGNTGFSSEIWGDVDQLMQAFRRPAYSDVVLKLRNPGDFKALRERLESDPRLTVQVKREVIFYEEQSERLAEFIRLLGMVLTSIFSVGAVLSAMITMYAAVASRTVEIGTLRALGFSRGNILTAILIESLLIGLIGGLGGLGAASFLQFINISTTNWQTFSEIAFNFALSQAIFIKSLLFALGMGLVGGLLPALRAARMNIVTALRAA